MLDRIKNINPKSITDLTQLQDLILLCLNGLESQAKIIAEQSQEIEELRNEINRLKGEHGDLPPRKPNELDKEKITGTKDKKIVKQKNHKKGSKNKKIKIDRTVKCKIDITKLPTDAKFQGYRKVIQQDLIIKRNNTLFKIPIYYSKENKRTYSGQLPEEYQGEFGGQLKSWIQLLYHYCDVTQGRMKCLMDNLGILISSGTISNIILSNVEQMKEESKEKPILSGLYKAKQDKVFPWSMMR